jgi:hypothetical protein
MVFTSSPNKLMGDGDDGDGCVYVVMNAGLPAKDSMPISRSNTDSYVRLFNFEFEFQI